MIQTSRNVKQNDWEKNSDVAAEVTRLNFTEIVGRCWAEQ